MWRLKVEDFSIDLFSGDDAWVSLQVEDGQWWREEVGEGGEEPSFWWVVVGVELYLRQVNQQKIKKEKKWEKKKERETGVGNREETKHVTP
jgi:hypothetical protein